MSEVSLPPSDDSDWNREFDPRSDARERALNILFEADLRAITPNEVVERMQVAIDDLTSILVVGVAEHRTRIDELITAHSHAWSIDRMATTDRNVLRMSTFELLGRSEVPTAVIINEAVELAKRYGTDDSGRFVNGMLSAIARTTREGGAPTPPLATLPSASPAPQPVTPPAAD
jgi:N utilization substance protein B